MISCDLLLELMPVTCSEEEEREKGGEGRKESIIPQTDM